MKNIVKFITLLIILLVFLCTIWWFYHEGEIAFFPFGQERRPPAEITRYLPFGQKDYSLSCRNIPDTDVTNIANFDEGEKWQGQGFFDYTKFFEGTNSIYLSSRDHETAEAQLEIESFNFENLVEIKFFGRGEGEDNEMEQLKVIFTDDKGDSLYEYGLDNLPSDWKMITLLKEKFVKMKNGQIHGLKFLLRSRPGGKYAVNLDFMWGERTKNYLRDWNEDSLNVLSLITTQGKAKLLMSGIDIGRTTIKQITAAKNFLFNAEITSLKGGNFGFFLRGDYLNGHGYYLMFEGVDSGNWQIFKKGIFNGREKTVFLAKGNLGDFWLARGKPYELTAKMDGQNMAFFVGRKGRDKIKIWEGKDGSFFAGGVGFFVASGNLLLVDDIYFQKLNEN